MPQSWSYGIDSVPQSRQQHVAFLSQFSHGSSRLDADNLLFPGLHIKTAFNLRNQHARFSIYGKCLLGHSGFSYPSASSSMSPSSGVIRPSAIIRKMAIRSCSGFGSAASGCLTEGDCPSPSGAKDLKRASLRALRLLGAQAVSAFQALEVGSLG